MKRLFFTLIIFVVFISVHAQKFKFSARASPNFSFTNVKQDNYSYPGVKQKGVGIRYSVGGNVEYSFFKYFSVSSGLWYTSKAVNLYMGDLYNKPGDPESKYYSQSRFNVNYFQIPFTAKGYTPSIRKNIKVYVQLGFTVDVKVAEKAKDTDFSYGANNYLHNTVLNKAYNNDGKVFKPVNVSFYLGSGVERSIGRGMAVFAGINFSKGLIPMLRTIHDGESGDISTVLHVNTTQIGLEGGFKFWFR